ncbi:MAG: hypothetical protein JST05_01165 [Acidobacteria bacterium]|nr:hypothetical protein [Acidobacteriota bacterium]
MPTPEIILPPIMEIPIPGLNDAIVQAQANGATPAPVAAPPAKKPFNWGYVAVGVLALGLLVALMRRGE